MTDTHISERYEFRNIKQNEAEEAAEIERICFPPNEACSKKHMKDRVAGIADLFLVVIDKENGKMAGFLNGLATDEVVLKDEFFTDAGLHNPEGKNIMLLGLDVLPEYRSQGLARELVRRYLEREWGRGRKEIILTCLESKVAMYEKFGFKDKGIAQSTWGGEEWHEMSVRFNYRSTWKNQRERFCRSIAESFLLCYCKLTLKKSFIFLKILSPRASHFGISNSKQLSDMKT